MTDLEAAWAAVHEHTPDEKPKRVKVGKLLGFEGLIRPGPSSAFSNPGQLFDAAAALAGLAPHVSYEAQAACELESVADPREEGAYAFDRADRLIDPAPALAALVADRRRGTLGAPGRRSSPRRQLWRPRCRCYS